MISNKSPEVKIEFDSYEYSNVKISDFLLDRAEKGYFLNETWFR